MIKEEWRLQKSLIGGLGSGLFPLLIFGLTAFCALISPLLLKSIDVSTVLLLLHIAILFYGLFVGGLGSLGESIMTRRLGQVNMLLQLPQTLPVSFRRVMAIFYLKDASFYLIYTFIPLLLGGVLAIPYVGVTMRGIAMLGVTLFITFMMGMGLSFALSALPGKSRPGSLLTVLLLIVLCLLAYPFKIIKPYQLLLPLGYWFDRQLYWLASGILTAILFAMIGTLLVKERYELQARKYEESFLSFDRKFSIFGGLRPLVAKEWLELERSGSIGSAIGMYAIHLIAVYALSWLFQNGFGMPLDFNVVFFGGFVGFMGVLTYSFLTGMEQNEYLNVIPVTVEMVVKAKLCVYFLLTSGVTVGYVFLIGLLKGEITLLPLSLAIAACTSIYVVAVTAYLTGLWTNTMFFGAGTMIRFAAFVVPPITAIEVGSLIIPYNFGFALEIIATAAMFAIILSIILLRRLDKKWSRRTFSSTSFNS